MIHKKTVFANAFALTTVILWTACSLFVVILPDFSLQVTQWWMHGLDMSVMGYWNLTLVNFVLGGVTLAASAWGAGWLWGWSLEQVSKKT